MFLYIYTLTLGDIIRHHYLRYHCYADVTQIYWCVDIYPVQDRVDLGIKRIKSCIYDIRQGMLKLYNNNTEFVIIGNLNSNFKGSYPAC